jgi:hypothetical protein
MLSSLLLGSNALFNLIKRDYAATARQSSVEALLAKRLIPGYRDQKGFCTPLSPNLTSRILTFLCPICFIEMGRG